MRVVEPDLPRPGRRDRCYSAPGVRSSATGALLTAALLVGGAASVYGVATPAVAACDVGASQARLAGARHLVTALRVGDSTDPRRAGLARDLRALGVTPAVATGWRQKAVDVSDQLRGTNDPTLQRVAVALARARVGPTPADLTQGELPGLVQDLGESTGRARDVLTGVVDAAGRAVSESPATPSSVDLARTGAGRDPRPSTETSTDLPEACTQTRGTDEENRAGPGDGTTDPGAADGPTLSSTASTPRTTTPVPEPPSESETGTPGSSREGPPTPTPPGTYSDFSEPTALSSSDDAPDTLPATPSTIPDTNRTGSGRPGDLRRAADAVQAVADLLRTLSEQSTPDADQLADELTRLLPNVDTTGPQPETRTTSPAPTSRSTPEPSRQPTTSALPSGSVDRSTTEVTAMPDTEVDDWEPQANELADQAQQAAGNDPLARELASRLESAGFGGDDDNADDSEDGASSTSEPDPTNSSTPPTSTPEASRTSTLRSPEQTSSEPGSSTPDSDVPGSSAESEADSPDSTGGQAASEATWDRLADCESSGDWSADTDNGYAGGLQFDPATWEAFGGQGPPQQASRAEQITVAQLVQAEQGWAAWPACSSKLGLR